MTFTQTGPDLQKVVCAMQWTCTGIPEFSAPIHPLEDLLQNFYALAGKRAVLASGRVSLQVIG